MDMADIERLGKLIEAIQSKFQSMDKAILEYQEATKELREFLELNKEVLWASM